MNRTCNRRRILQSAVAGAWTAATLPAIADGSSHAGTSRVFYGYPPGGAGAVVAGIVMKEMQGRYQPDLGVEPNCMPGNTGARSILAALKAPADGGTVLYSPSTGLTLTSHLRTLPGVDLARDFVAVAPLVEFTFALTVGPAVPAAVRTVPDYLAWVRENPSLGGYGLPGLGTAPHFVGMALARTAEVPLKAVAYQGLKPMTQDVLGGSMPAAMMVLDGGDGGHDERLRPLAVLCAKRWPTRPELPTLRELGLADIDHVESFGFHLPAATPAVKVQELNDAVQHAIRSPLLAARLAGSLMRSVASTPQAYADTLARERAAWGQVVKREGFSMQS